ncbi:MAG: phospho-N-acetylmuramoyl-pentapeptide-transferase [Vampirovibrionales bacterium]
MTLPNLFPMFIVALLWLATGTRYIGWLKTRSLGQAIREEGPQAHHSKAGTPTMGGLLLLVLVVATFTGFTLVQPALMSVASFWVILTLLLFGGLGVSDDWLKVTKQTNDGISGWAKLGIQAGLGLGLGVWMMMAAGPHSAAISTLSFGPASWGLSVNLGWLYPVFAMLVVTGASNAYNLTDGLDGLAASSGYLTFMGFAVVLAARPDLMLWAVLLAGGCLGFLWFNRHPARLFMGDTGSLALGGVMGVMGLLGKVELYLLLLCGLYVIETLSVMLQVAYFKLTKGKRLFKMSPLHHHFELCGWREPTIVLSFGLLQACFTLMALIVYHWSIA